MIFSPVTAGLFSLMTLGRIGTAWASILAKKMEVLARLTAPIDNIRRMSQVLSDRRHTVASPHGRRSGSGEPPAEEANDPSLYFDTTDRRSSDPGPAGPGRVVTKSTTISSVDSSASPIEKLHQAPIHSSINLAATALNTRKLKQHKANHAEIDFEQEIPQSVQTNAVMAGAVAIHVPKRFENVLRARNWERLIGNNLREISTEHSREPSSDPAFENFSQYVLPPTALLLDPTFRVYPESMFREAAAGLLQLGFGLYQLISDDAKMSVKMDGLASPYLLVLPYLMMAAVNILVNVLDPPYSVVTVLDISKEARQALIDNDDSPALSPSSSFAVDPLGSYPRESSNSSINRKISNLRQDSSIIWEDKSVHFAKSASTSMFTSDGNGTWAELSEWVNYAYGRRIDICPVDRLYQTPWLSHAIVIGEFVWSALSGLLVPAILLAAIGAWTHFRTSTYGYSLAFNILALFGIPFIQFVLCTCHLLSRVLRDLKGRREYGTSYWEPSHEHQEVAKSNSLVRWMTGQVKPRSKWWDLAAQSLGLYFPVRKTIIVLYVTVVAGIATCEFVLVGFNLMRTLNCNMALLM